MAKFARDYAEAHSDALVLPHFIGVSPGSTDIQRTLLRLCHEIARRLEMTDEIPEGRPVALLFDTVDQPAKDAPAELPEHPQLLAGNSQVKGLVGFDRPHPSGLRLIVSTLEGARLELRPKPDSGHTAVLHDCYAPRSGSRRPHV